MLDEVLIYDKIKQIKFDNLNGASQIARNALNVLKLFVSTNKTITCAKCARAGILNSNKLAEVLKEKSIFLKS